MLLIHQIHQTLFKIIWVEYYTILYSWFTKFSKCYSFTFFFVPISSYKHLVLSVTVCWLGIWQIALPVIFCCFLFFFTEFFLKCKLNVLQVCNRCSKILGDACPKLPKNTGKMCENSSKLKIQSPEQLQDFPQGFFTLTLGHFNNPLMSGGNKKSHVLKFN